MPLRWLLSCTALAIGCLICLAAADEPNSVPADQVAADATLPEQAALDLGFTDTVRPFLERHCLECHGSQKQEAKLDLSGFTSRAAAVKNHGVWEHVLTRLSANEMPPKDAPNQPTPEERQAVVDWIRQLRQDEAQRHAGDPGMVLARRLSGAEYDYTIRDLTGVDIRPTREFPVDPANEAGFDNSGESLAMSPALLKKYLAAARLVADHVVLKPDGFAFAPDPAVTDTDRDKYCVRRIMDFYARHPLDYADYFLAAWTFQHKARLGRPDAALADMAAEAGLSGKYLDTVWLTLTADQPAGGPLDAVRHLWRNLPADGNAQAARPACERLRDEVLRLRKELAPQVDQLKQEGMSPGSQPLVLWKNRRQASLRMVYTGDKNATDLAAREQFCRVFPDAMLVSDRGPYFDPSLAGQGRPLTAGFHLMQGYFRDDEPLCELVLSPADRQELETLWQELNFVTAAPLRQYKDFLFFERAESPFMQEAKFDFARPENKDALTAANMAELRKVYLAKAREIGAAELAIEAIETYFDEIAALVRWVEETRLFAEPAHLAELTRFAERAYRRPLAAEERQELLAFYRALRDEDALSHEEAIRDCVASVLLSPHFCYRSDLAAEGADAQPLSDYALASRLSYFLWSSMPDDELLRVAAAGELRRPDVLAAQTRRMLGDLRVRGLATEFAGNWLEFRRFEEHNSVDRDRFPAFTAELRQAMFEEPLRFFMDVARSNGSVLDFLYADHTFVNPPLAAHYGMPAPAGGPDDWTRVDGARRYGRGGLLPMAVFLTRNSPGLRTSPVKRGYWVTRRLLGEQIPPPPPGVPELPKDEASLGDLTLPELLARHREDRACAVCHQRFDSIGLAFEGYGPIGERRELDLGGRPVQDRGIYPDGGEWAGVDGLRSYVAQRRQDDFIDNLCRKLFSYGLGRTLILSDEPAIEAMRQRLAADDYRLQSLIETIVTSSQFLNKRGRDDLQE